MKIELRKGLLLVYLFVFPIQGYAVDLCSDTNATLECLMKYPEELYSADNSRFWTILNTASKKAVDCKSPRDMASFMRLIRIQRDGDLDEYLHKSIENMCTSNSKCFFNALLLMPRSDQEAIVDLLLNPLFEDHHAINAAFEKEKKSAKFGRIARLYIRRTQDLRK
jgi:hypothetical protein